MNVYRLVADTSHLFAILYLLYTICKRRSCYGISGKSQLLLLMVFVTRYLDLFYHFVSYYNSFLKVIFILSTALTVVLIFVIFRSTYDSEHDTFHVIFLLLPVGVLAFYFNHEFSVLEVLWVFSIFLEAVAILPQFFMIRKTGEMEMFTYHYLFALGLYRAFYIFNWVYRYSHEGFYDVYAFWSGCVQTALFCYFLYTKESLKRQARAYFKLQSSGGEAPEMLTNNEKMLIHAMKGKLETDLLANEPESVAVHNQTDDSSMRVSEALGPQGSDITAQPGSHHGINAGLAAAGSAAQPVVGGDTNIQLS